LELGELTWPRFKQIALEKGNVSNMCFTDKVLGIIADRGDSFVVVRRNKLQAAAQPLSLVRVVLKFVRKKCYIDDDTTIALSHRRPASRHLLLC